MNFKSRLSVALLPSTWRVPMWSPSVWVFNTVPEDKRVLYFLSSELPSLPVWAVKLEALTPYGRFPVVTLEITPELSHTFSSGLNVAPR